MALISIKTNPSRRELRQFAALWFPTFWLIVGSVSWKATDSLVVAGVIWLLTFVVSIVGFFFPELMRYIFIGWMWAAYPVGWVVAHVLLAGIYYVVLTPIGLTLRALGRDPIQRKIDRHCSSYWQPHRSDENTLNYFHQY